MTLKAFNGLASASVKTVNGLAKASVKNFNGLAFPASIPTGMDLEYLFDQNVNDTSGNGRNGTATNLTYSQPGWKASAYAGSFNAASTKVSFADSTAYSSFELTIAFRATDLGATRVLFCANNQNYFCQLTTAGALGFATQGGSYDYTTTSNGVVSSGTKYLAKFIYSASGGYKKIKLTPYGGSESEVMNKTGLSGNLAGSGTTKIGVYYDESYGWWKGEIGLFRIYPSILSAGDNLLLDDEFNS